MEALVAVSVFTLLGSAVMTGVSATSRAGNRIDVSAEAGNLARNQMEVILATSYQDPPYIFTTITPLPGYSLTAKAEEFVPGDPNIAQIVVTAFLNNATVAQLESLRVKELP